MTEFIIIINQLEDNINWNDGLLRTWKSLILDAPVDFNWDLLIDLVQQELECYVQAEMYYICAALKKMIDEIKKYKKIKLLYGKKTSATES